MCTSDASFPSPAGSASMRRAALVILAAAMAVTGSLAASAATQSKAVGSKHALQCPPTIVAACKKNEQRVCRQTDSKGCCVKVFCVQR